MLCEHVTQEFGDWPMGCTYEPYNAFLVESLEGCVVPSSQSTAIIRKQKVGIT